MYGKEMTSINNYISAVMFAADFITNSPLAKLLSGATQLTMCCAQSFFSLTSIWHWQYFRLLLSCLIALLLLNVLSTITDELLSESEFFFDADDFL